jgi:hypothetical protein
MAYPEFTKNPRLVYTPEALAACEKALRTILTNIGPWGTRLSRFAHGTLAEFLEHWHEMKLPE